MRRRLSMLFSAALLSCTALVACGDKDDAHDLGADAGQEVDTLAVDGVSADGIRADTAKPPLPLSPDLCNDPNNMAVLLPHLASGVSSPSYGTVNVEQFQRLAAAPTKGPFYMVNLIRYRDKAKYADGRPTALTGREANALYSPTEFLSAIGARIVFNGSVERTTLGQDGTWHDVAIVEYPCPLAFLAMSAHPDFQARSVHKDAGLEASVVMVTHLQPLGDSQPTATPFPSTPSDPTFEQVQVYRFRAEAQYQAGTTEPTRSGEEAMDLYAAGARAAKRRLGISVEARLKVEGVLIGDGRSWDEVWIDRLPSRAAFDALVVDAAFVQAERHRRAAVEEAYELAISPMVSIFPEVP